MSISSASVSEYESVGSVSSLSRSAVWMLVMHYIDIFYMVMPTVRQDEAYMSAVDILCFVGIGGLFVAWLFALLKKRALVPVKDPLLPESLAFENY